MTRSQQGPTLDIVFSVSSTQLKAGTGLLMRGATRETSLGGGGYKSAAVYSTR